MNQQILEKAIQKAIDGGWEFDWVGKKIIRSHSLDKGDEFFDVTASYFLFNHDFAKALWPPKLIKVRSTNSVPTMDGELVQENTMLETWEYHLQQMVIAEDPVKYLGDNT